MKNRPEIGVSTAVFRDGRVLLARRAVGALQNLWSLPGGRLEHGERMAEAALRELDEEVAVKAEIIDLAGIVEVMPRAEGPQFHFIVMAFAANWVSGEPQTGPEASDVCWADPETLDNLDVTDDLHRIVASAARLVAERGRT
ncbi:NUDIX hydrolase [Terrihabitans sp. B22-R8]|uniref:NUDIX hydrolase n=1 Tax=Terrihabitans sp. B22-R8 TaxID=3425128 RepID=UPI00403C54AC